MILFVAFLFVKINQHHRLSQIKPGFKMGRLFYSFLILVSLTSFSLQRKNQDGNKQAFSQISELQGGHTGQTFETLSGHMRHVTSSSGLKDASKSTRSQKEQSLENNDVSCGSSLIFTGPILRKVLHEALTRSCAKKFAVSLRDPRTSPPRDWPT